jgi:hypothetical protein
MLSANHILSSIGEGLLDKIVAVLSCAFDRDEDISVFHKPRIRADAWSIVRSNERQK